MLLETRTILYIFLYENKLYLKRKTLKTLTRWHRYSYHVRTTRGNPNCSTNRSSFIFSRVTGSLPRFSLNNNVPI